MIEGIIENSMSRKDGCDVMEDSNNSQARMTTRAGGRDKEENVAENNFSGVLYILGCHDDGEIYRFGDRRSYLTHLSTCDGQHKFKKTKKADQFCPAIKLLQSGPMEVPVSTA